MKGNDSFSRPDTCGCAMGAKMMLIALLGSLIFYGFQFHDGQVTARKYAGMVFAVTFLGAGAGKLLGIALYRLRKSRSNQTKYQPQP